MRDVHIIANNVCFSYDNSSPLFENLTADFGPGWTGLVGENGSGKTTFLKLVAGLLVPVTGHMYRRGECNHASVIYCAQRTDDLSVDAERFLRAEDEAARRLRGILHLESDFADRWNTLSHGERKKVQTAAALWQEPGVLALDEPTNHLDRTSVQFLEQALTSFRGTGFIVSHDRTLLDTLCSRCLFFHPPRTVLRPGGYTQGLTQEQAETAHQVHMKKTLQEEARKLEREISRRRDLKAKRRSRHKARTDPDTRFKRNRARLTGKDAVGGRLASQLKGRLRQTKSDVDHISVDKRHAAGVWVSGAVCPRKRLFYIEAGTIALAKNRSDCGLLTYPYLAMKPTDRIAVTGPNGSGKSTLIRFILQSLTIPPQRIIYLPQEIPRSDCRLLLDEVLSLPSREQGQLLSLVSRLGSRPHRLFASEDPSPGETRKLLLAQGILREPYLILMDEPTNHLDAVAVQSLSDALTFCPCGLLLVSHDRRFLEDLTTIRWDISPGGDGNRYVLRVL